MTIVFTKRALQATPETSAGRSAPTRDANAAVDRLSDSSVKDLVHLFKLLADETRLRILYYLRQADELNVLELCQKLRQRQPSVSHHLALLRVAGLIDMRREGKHNYYRVLPRRFEELIGLMFDTPPGHPPRICFESFELQYTPMGSPKSSVEG